MADAFFCCSLDRIENLFQKEKENNTVTKVERCLYQSCRVKLIGEISKLNDNGKGVRLFQDDETIR